VTKAFSCWARTDAPCFRAASTRHWRGSRRSSPKGHTSSSSTRRKSEDEMRAGHRRLQRQARRSRSPRPAGKHFMPGKRGAGAHRPSEIVVYPQDILAASVQAIRTALGGLKRRRQAGKWPAPPSWQRRSVRTSTWPRNAALARIRADLGAASRARTGGKHGDSRYRMATHLASACAGLGGSDAFFAILAEAISARAVVGRASGAWSLSRNASGRRVRAKNHRRYRVPRLRPAPH